MLATSCDTATGLPHFQSECRAFIVNCRTLIELSRINRGAAHKKLHLVGPPQTTYFPPASSPDSLRLPPIPPSSSPAPEPMPTVEIPAYVNNRKCGCDVDDKIPTYHTCILTSTCQFYLYFSLFNLTRLPWDVCRVCFQCAAHDLVVPNAMCRI
jgi:hypothetical protein